MVKKSRNVVSSNLESKVKVGLSLTPSSADRLNSIARKLGISRSELLERLAQGALDISSDKSEVSVTWKKGEETEVEPAQLEGETAEESEINDAVTAESLSSKVSVQPNPLQASYESLQQQLSEGESLIAKLQQQLATEQQNLASQLAETVSKSSYEALQQQLSEGESSIAQLQQQLAETEHREHEFQQQLASKSSALESLQQQVAETESSIAKLQQQLATEQQNLASQLAETVSKSSYESLQQQFATEKQNLAQQLAETVPKSSYESLQHQLVSKSSAIGDFQVQLTKLQYLENQLSQSVAKQRNYDALQQQSQEQLRTIKALREQLGQMQAVAGIGEAYLNKWRRP